MENLLLKLWVFLISLMQGTVFASTSPELRHSNVQIAVSTEKGKQVQLQFAVKMKQGLQVNAQAPWLLQITDYHGFKITSTRYGQDYFLEDIPGFQLLAEKLPVTGPVKLEYKLTAFLCTQDKSRCYREVHQGRLNTSAVDKKNVTKPVK